MPVTQQQLNQAAAVQSAAARDTAAQVRLIAGPGTGKSFTIEERVAWLLQSGIPAREIFAISFTNASARDLRARVVQACQRVQQNADDVSVTTMHSLALRVLRAANLLNRFPVSPAVLDQWEIREIPDAEHCSEAGVNMTRSQQIRRDHEANWSTGRFGPPGFIPPNPPVTQPERDAFAATLRRVSETYACIPPGAIVRECVEAIRANLVNPAQIIPIRHLIVDEYQDLNPIDLEFVASFTNPGVVTFVAGDDDQSIYSFRYAMPRGIQQFTTQFPNAGDHQLNECFRCASDILAAANSLIAAHPSANRIPKALQSVYSASNPVLPGSVFRWRFPNGATEARSIASSCSTLIAEGVPASEIMILLSNTNLQQTPITDALTAAQVPYEVRGEGEILAAEEMRVLYNFLRVTGDRDDYVAHRALLGLLPRVGVATCIGIKNATVANNLNFRDIFYNVLPAGVFSGGQTRAIGRVAGSIAHLAQFDENSQLVAARPALLLAAVEYGQPIANAIDAFLNGYPDATTVRELRQLMTASEDARVEILTDIFQREGRELPAELETPARVKIMTMHGAKGLSARVVFIPGLEEQVFPGDRRRPYPGLIEEAARMLYVSITRARAACIMSFADTRVVHGAAQRHGPSRFNASLGGAFANQNQGLTAAVAARIVRDCGSL